MSLSTSEHIVYLALGSNLGDRLAHLRSAVDALRADRGLRVIDVSPIYESPAHRVTPAEDQPDFLNAVVKLSTTLDPHALLQRLHHIERMAGRRRERDARWAPRSLDLDVLIFGQEVIRTESLTVPHPRMAQRRFVLQPLADLDPMLHVPDPFNKTVDELLASCPDPDRPVPAPFTF